MYRARVHAGGWLMTLLAASAVIVAEREATAATISLQHSTGGACLTTSSAPTTDVATGDSLITSCDTTLSGGASYSALLSTRALFGGDGLELGASVTLDAVSEDFHKLVSAQATATFTDMITLLGGALGTDGFLELTFDVSGSSSASGGEFESALGFMQFFAGTTFGGSVGFTGPTTVVASVPFTFGEETQLRLFLSALASSSIGPSSGTTFTGTADFLSTATLLGVRVLDENKDVLPDGRVDSASNLTYPQLTVPEPATLVLLGTGLAAFAARRRRSPGRPPC